MPVFQFSDEISTAMIPQSPVTVHNVDSIPMEHSQNITDELHGTRQELIWNNFQYTVLLLDSQLCSTDLDLLHYTAY